MFSVKVKRMVAAVEGRRTLEAAAKVPHTRGSSRGPLQQPHDGGGEATRWSNRGTAGWRERRRTALE